MARAGPQASRRQLSRCAEAWRRRRCLAVRQASEAPCRARPASGRCGGPASTPVSTATAIRCLRKWRKTTIHGKARRGAVGSPSRRMAEKLDAPVREVRSEEHTSELQSLMRISYDVLGLKKQTTKNEM